mmetsp:Transcript_12698/g.27008  ORF Transcript_12698/g.27008 Transcript_12698/m.27008 type:complete len:324 (-) Transcript_12698:298-1269(-)
MKIAALLVGLLVSPQAYGFAPSQKSSSLLSRPTNNNVVFSQGNIPAPITTSGNTPCIFSSGHSISSSSRLFMGWGPEPIWSTCTVTSNIQACPSGSCVSLKIDVPDGNDFLYPGQYVQVLPSDAAADTKPLFLAIASAPTGTPPKPVRPSAKKTSEADSAAGPDETSSPTPATWEFLVKKNRQQRLAHLPPRPSHRLRLPAHGIRLPHSRQHRGLQIRLPHSKHPPLRHGVRHRPHPIGHRVTATQRGQAGLRREDVHPLLWGAHPRRHVLRVQIRRVGRDGSAGRAGGQSAGCAVRERGQVGGTDGIRAKCFGGGWGADSQE